MVQIEPAYYIFFKILYVDIKNDIRKHLRY